MSKKLSEITEATTFATTDIFNMVVSGNSRKVAISSLFALAAKSTLAAGTLTADAPFQLTQAWNNAAITFTGLKANITDTASAAGSLLMDLQVGGVTQFSVSKAGLVRIRGIADAAGGFYTQFGASGLQHGGFWASGTSGALGAANGAGLALASNVAFGWSGTSNSPVSAVDLKLERDAADILAQRRGVNAQTFRLYNTYTDASNYERGFMRWSGNVLEIGSEAAGTGTARNLKLMAAGGNVTCPSIQSQDGYLSFFETQAGAYAGTFTERSILITTTDATRLGFRSNGQITWNDRTVSQDVGTSVDTGIGRASAGVAKITNGSTGTGELIFIVPTVDPAIAGALWNNAGTLAISAG